MVFLGFGKYVRADRIYALEPIMGNERGNGRRTLVWVEGIPDPVVASRTQETILEEMELLVARAGFTPLEAIRAATQIGAMTMAQGQNRGVIAPGHLADMIVLARDPTADIANIRSIQFTVKNGRRFDRNDYRPISAEEAGNDDD